MSVVANPFVLAEALLTTNRLGSGRELSHDLKSAIVDFNIYEDITKPYTTAQVSFADTKDTLSSLDIQGGEYLDIHIKPSSYSGSKGITKRFHVMKIEKGIRAGENSELVLLNCIDEVGFRSYMKNVNVLLEGSPLQIINRVCNEYLDTDLIHNEEKFEQIYKLIVPNLTPLQTIAWISRKAITTIGMPHFVFASFADDSMRYLDLEDMLNFDTLNPNSPFVYGFNASSSKNLYDFGTQTFSIKDYSYTDNHNIASIIEKGMLNGSHSYYDTMRNKEFVFEFKASSDLFAQMHEQNLFKSSQSRVPIAPDMTMDDEKLEEYTSRKVYNIGTSVPWNDGYTAYNERPNYSTYVNDATNEATRAFMGKDTLNWKFDVKHLGHIQGGVIDGAHMVGKKLKVIFSKPDPDLVDNTNGMVDLKKSGDYLITSVRHQMNKESYSIIVNGSKLATLDTQYMPTGAM